MTLVERADELARLKDLFIGTREGRGAVSVISGPVATGKTRLIRALTEHAAGNAMILSALGARDEQALPLGVVGQLMSGLPELGAAKLVTTSAQEAAAHRRELYAAVLGLAALAPLLVCVDDVHFADAPSLYFLSYLARRTAAAPIMIVLGECEHVQPASPQFRTELLNLAHCHRTRLTVLSENGLAQMLSDEIGGGQAYPLAPAWYAASGGNPLLVQALLEDRRVWVKQTAGQRPDQLVVGDAYAQAVLTCLHRGGAQLLEVAKALAVLGEPASPEVLQRLIGGPIEQITRPLHALHRAGLLDNRRFRHPVARAAVLGCIEAQERARMHRLAAQALHDEGQDAGVVATHLVAAEVTEPWAVLILREGAERALAAGRAELAVRSLKLAHRACPDERERASIQGLLTNAEWQVDPSRAARHMPEVTTAIDTGYRHGRYAVESIGCLLWYGRVAEAEAAVERLTDAVDRLDAETTAQLQVVKLWLACLSPKLLSQLDCAAPRDRDILAATEPALIAAWELGTVLKHGADDETAARAVQVVERFRQHNVRRGPAAVALLALIYADRLDQAKKWCDRLLDEESVRRMPTWRALFAALRAEIAVRAGDMRTAERHARDALTWLPLQSWGVAIGAPLSSIVLATTAMGRYDQSDKVLSMPVPKEMFHTPFGLYYLQARGRYYLSTGRATAALGDFLSCRELMRRWGVDLSALVSWRAEAASALLALGRREDARRLVNEQLSHSGGQRRARARGMSLRLLAATSELRHRPALLREAIEVLHSCGDRLELVRTVTDLGHTYRTLGRPGLAWMTVQLAGRIAEECHVVPLWRRLGPGRSGSADGPPDYDADSTQGNSAQGNSAQGNSTQGNSKLSDAEQRVAMLAAQGYTNREIATELFVTVSTVEQHLTKAYRKLNVRRRTDLAEMLRMTLADILASPVARDEGRTTAATAVEPAGARKDVITR
jgi:DNA-binding CsgD family transcriptional regulator